MYRIYGEFDLAGDVDRPANSPLLCHLKIYTRPWQNFTEYTLTCDEPPRREYRVSRTKRSLLYDTHAADDVRSRPSTADDDEQLLDSQFDRFQRDFRRQYADAAEHQRRRQIFAGNLRRIDDLNANERGTARYGVTHFADMDAAEFARWTGLRAQRDDASATNEVRNARATIPDVPVPRAFDWRERGVITAVKNQGSCGSCWAFSVTGNIEGLHAIKTGRLEEYSEQELVDCDTDDHGCNGGLPDNAYK